MKELFKDDEGKEPDDLMCRKTWGRIEVGITPMIFGWRIRAGIVKDGYYFLDYCAGSDQKEIENIYSLVLTILNKNGGDLLLTIGSSAVPDRDLTSFMFNDFPRQERKPMTMDPVCYSKLIEMCGPEIVSIKLPDVSKLKAEYMWKNHADFVIQAIISQSQDPENLDQPKE